MNRMKSLTRLSVITFMALILVACGFPIGRPAATPTALPTPIPGYVAGEEEFALASFLEYYDENCHSQHDGNNFVYVVGLDEDAPATAAYVGDGLWRFHIQVKHIYAEFYADDVGEYDVEESINVEPETVTAISQYDGTWTNINYCRSSGDESRDNDYDRDYSGRDYD